MRVTKTVKEYIYKEVTARMERKYAEEAAEAQRQRDLYEKIEEEALRTAAEAYEICVKAKIAAFKAEDFLKMSTDTGLEVKLDHQYRSLQLCLMNQSNIDSVHCWRRRMQKEVNEKCDDIIVTLELGGTRDELMKMLAEI
jgi:hypothetical protein